MSTVKSVNITTDINNKDFSLKKKSRVPTM